MLASGLIYPGCTGGRAALKGCVEAGCLDTPTASHACVDAQVEGELDGGWLPHRPFWVDGAGLHLVHLDRDLGIVWQCLSRETGQELSHDGARVFPPTIDPAFWGVEAVVASPLGDLAIALAYMDEDGIEQDRLLSLSGGISKTWMPRWQGKYYAMGLGWDGEAFTASLVDVDTNWAAARFAPQPTTQEEAEAFGQAAARDGYYDSETDAQSGTTVFAGAAMPGVAVAGRRDRDKRLTSSASGWQFSTGDASPGWATALALNDPTAVVAWAEADVIIREISLDTGEVLQGWTLPKDPGDNVFEQVAVARVSDRWVLVAQDYRGLVMAEIRNGALTYRRVLHHPPAACVESNSCGMSSAWRWRGRRLAVVKDGDLAWAGVLDMSTQRVQSDHTLFT